MIVISQISITIQEKGSTVFLQGHVIYSRELKQKTAELVLYLQQVDILVSKNQALKI